MIALRGSCGEPDRDEREPERGGVGEHVRGVGEQRERLGDDAHHDLDAHEADDQGERDRQLADVGVGGDAVRVSRVGAVAVCVAAVSHPPTVVDDTEPLDGRLRCTRPTETQGVVNGLRPVSRAAGGASRPTRTFARLCASLTEEAEAIGWYEQRLAVEADPEARAIMSTPRVRSSSTSRWTSNSSCAARRSGGRSRGACCSARRHRRARRVRGGGAGDEGGEGIVVTTAAGSGTLGIGGLRSA